MFIRLGLFLCVQLCSGIPFVSWALSRNYVYELLLVVYKMPYRVYVFGGVQEFRHELGLVSELCL